MLLHYLTGLPPEVDRHTRILILGSFPGTASLAAQQYYAHPRNQFWRLLSGVTGEDLAPLPYVQRLQRIKTHGIGLWDAIASCERNGSLDSAIRNAVFNDFTALKRRCPDLSRICFNGKTSGKFSAHFAAEGFDTLTLPSSSPANAQMSFEHKLTAWQKMLM